MTTRPTDAPRRPASPGPRGGAPARAEPDAPAAVDLTPVAGWLAVLDQVAKRREDLDAVEAKAREAIQARLGEATEGLLDGRPVIRWLHTKGARRFNAKRFRKDHPDLAEQYYEVGPPGRRFERVKPQEEDEVP